MWTDEKLVKLENRLKQEGLLYILTYGINSFSNLHDFLYQFFNDFNRNSPTYFDDTLTKIQTIEKKHRSLGEIYRIALNYFPELKIKDLIKELHDPSWFIGFGVYASPKNGNIITLLCLDIRRQIFELYEHCGYGIHSRPASITDELGFYQKDIEEIINS